MADEAAPQIEAIFPAPPPFYRHFTVANLDKLRELKLEAGIELPTSKKGDKNDDWDAQRLLDLPPELRYLIPPPAPASGKYRSFGAPWDLNEKIPTLKDLKIEQLFPDSPKQENHEGTQSQWTLDRAFYLKKIVRSILLNFLELVGTLSVNPEHAEDKLADIEVLFLNAHHLINEYRPHQARESLILEMEDQLERKKAEIDGVRKMKDKIGSLMAELGHEGREALQAAERRDTNTLGARKQAEQIAVWEALGSEFAV